ncbi:hypothetical protein [Ensifer aridi]|uniref:hypothetical protein n=1 Tax=Ensifer aridi TaxID=1708715 RepID=UPI0004249DD9|nr:hypothetical protein [Ensifer aridi]
MTDRESQSPRARLRTTAFFCLDEHLSAWRSARSAEQPRFRQTIAEGLEAGRALFGPSLAGLDHGAEEHDGSQPPSPRQGWQWEAPTTSW